MSEGTVINDTYQFTTDRESVTEKDWAAGSSKPIEQPGYYASFGGTSGKTIVMAHKAFTFAPSWLKSIDEVIVNAIDQVIRTMPANREVHNTGTQVSIIKIEFCNGQCIIYNDGPGLDVVIHPRATEHFGKPTYVPTLVFGVLFQGANRKKDSKSIIGGTNGLGAKIANCFSKKFSIETIDAVRGLHFTQTWTNNMQNTDGPIIRASKAKPYTSVAFSLDVDKFGDTRHLTDVVLTRAIYASVYAHLCSTAIKVYFNNILLPTHTASDITKYIYPGVAPISMTHIGEFSYEIACTMKTKDSISHLSVVNGIVVRDGNHFTKIKDLICTGVKTKLSKIFNASDFVMTPSFLSDNVFIFINAQIPGAGWDGQRKDCLVVDLRAVKLTVTPKFIGQIATMLEDLVRKMVLSKKTKKKKVEYEKYTPARKFNPKPLLFLMEGDSALDQVKNGILANESLDHYGLFSSGGVFMNVRKKSVITMTDTRKLVKMTDKLKDNVVLNGLFDALGLNPAYNYDETQVSCKVELDSLRYAGIIACVDQDLDGKGNILGLLLNIFNCFWPKLVDRGFVKWYATPIINAFPRAGSEVLSFYSEASFKLAKVDPSRYHIRYYKGMATHDEDSIKACMRNISQKIHTFYNDKDSLDKFESYYGKSAAPRKVELSRPLGAIPDELALRQEESKLISATDHLSYEVFAYCKDNLERKLDSCIDGQNQAGRKILNAILRAFVPNNEMRVSQLAGYVSEKENYHHGEASLCDSIKCRAFVAVGGKQLPLLVPLSAFGSRLCGGKNAGSPRYIYTKLNARLTKLLFPAEDYQILKFNFAEGKRCEPQYFLPIVPLAICESTEIPAHGWKLKIWARSVHDCISTTIEHIKGINSGTPLRLYTYNNQWTGTTRYIRGKLHSVGTYEVYEGKISKTGKTMNIHVTELPLRTWTSDYIAAIKKRDDKNKFIKKIIDDSNSNIVNITFVVDVDVYHKLNDYGDSSYTDGIEEYFMLHDHMDEALNMMLPDYSVKEFNSYVEVLNVWFEERKRGYIDRCERSIILQDAEIELISNQLRYLRAGLKMTGLTNVQQDNLLEREKYIRFNKSAISNPNFVPNSELVEYVREGTYNYLLDLTDRDKSDENILKREELLKQRTVERDNYVALAHTGRFTGAAIWQQELLALSKVIKDGENTRWQFGEHNKYKFK